MATRAKFRCTSVESYSLDPDGNRKYRFQAEYDASVPEDERYSKYTPAGSLEITVTNPVVEFKPGTSYYLDLTEVAAQ